MSQGPLIDIPPNASASFPLIIGDKYKVVRLIGEGGMGAVYEAENTWTRRRVAVKVMRPEYTRDNDSVQRFMREAQTAAQIEHPNVVDVLDMGRDAATGSLYIVQAFLDGIDLRTLFETRKVFSPEEALELMLPVMDGLVAAHAKGVVHRDLKPENIFLVEARGGRRVPKIIDFGIAKALNPQQNEFRTMIAQTVGTPAYMSPEQALGGLDLDARTDIWSVGVVLYEMLSGRLPYDFDESPQVMLATVIKFEPLPLDVAAPGLPQELRGVIQAALRHDRNQRYPDMQSFHDALSATSAGNSARDTLRKNAPVFPEGAPVAVAQVAQVASRAAPRLVQRSRFATLQEPADAPQRSPALMIGAAGVLLFLIGTAVLSFRGARAPTAPAVITATREPAAHAAVTPRAPAVAPIARSPAADDAGTAALGAPDAADPRVDDHPSARHHHRHSSGPSRRDDAHTSHGGASPARIFD